jgi:hypothetical protein
LAERLAGLVQRERELPINTRRNEHGQYEASDPSEEG